MPPIQPIKATDTEEAARAKNNSAILRVNELDNTAADIAAMASSANAAARISSAARDQARVYAEGAVVAVVGVAEDAAEATAARIGAVTARNQAEAFRNEANQAKQEAEQSVVTAGEHRDEANEARDAAAISRGAAQVSAAAALLSATESEAERQEAEAAALRAEEAENSLLEWQGQWVTLKAYKLGDIVRHDGTSYVAEEAHTAGTFLTDLADGKWSVFAQRGAAGPGSGDMLESVYDPQGIGLDAFTRANHTGQQAISTVTGLQAALDGKSAVGHAHPIAQVTGLQDALNGKSPTGHEHSAAEINDATATGRAVLTGNADAGRIALGVNDLTGGDEAELMGGADTRKRGWSALALFSWFRSLSLGHWQTWRDFRWQRGAGQNYVNDTARPIVVSIVTNAPPHVHCFLRVDGIIVANQASAINIQSTLSAIVPPGSTYRYDGATNFIAWSELR